MKTISPDFDTIKKKLESSSVYVKVGREAQKVHEVTKRDEETYVFTSKGKYKVTLMSELYLE